MLQSMIDTPPWHTEVLVVHSVIYVFLGRQLRADSMYVISLGNVHGVFQCIQPMGTRLKDHGR